MKLHRSGDSSVNGWSLLLEDDGDPPEPQVSHRGRGLISDGKVWFGSVGGSHLCRWRFSQVLNLAGSSSSFLRHEELMNTQYIGPVRR